MGWVGFVLTLFGGWLLGTTDIGFLVCALADVFWAIDAWNWGKWDLFSLSLVLIWMNLRAYSRRDCAWKAI